MYLCERYDFKLASLNEGFIITERVNGLGDITYKFSSLDKAFDGYVNFLLVSRIKCLDAESIDDLDLGLLMASLYSKYEEFSNFLSHSYVLNVGYRFRLKVTPCVRGCIYSFKLVGDKRELRFYMNGEWSRRVPRGATPIRVFYNRLVVVSIPSTFSSLAKLVRK